MNPHNLPEDLQYTVEHEWVKRLDDGRVRMGITDFAQSELGDVVFVELPTVGSIIKAGSPLGSVESVKTVSELYSPVTGKVTAVNSVLSTNPGMVNEDAYGEGWLVEIQLSDPQNESMQMLDAAAYRKRLPDS